jgi:hypothetical protein
MDWPSGQVLGGWWWLFGYRAPITIAKRRRLGVESPRQEIVTENAAGTEPWYDGSARAAQLGLGCGQMSQINLVQVKT